MKVAAKVLLNGEKLSTSKETAQKMTKAIIESPRKQAEFFPERIWVVQKPNSTRSSSTGEEGGNLIFVENSHWSQHNKFIYRECYVAPEFPHEMH